MYRFQGKIKSHDPKLDGKVFYLGKIEPQESKTNSFTIDIPKDQSRQEIPLQIEFEEYNGFSPEGLQAVITIEGPPRPRLAYNYKIVDDGSGNSVGNGDGRIQTGEAVDLLLTLRNIGVVSAQDIWVEMGNPTGQHLEIRPGRIKFGLLNPDQSKQSRISFTVWPEYPHSQIAFKLFIQEKSQKVFLNEVLKMAVDSHPPSQIVTTNKLITVTEDSATILSGAGPESPAVASVEKGQSLAVTGELGDWYRVQLSDSEVGWITKVQASVVTQTAMGSMPIPKIQGLEASRSAQFITLSEELQRQRVEREQAEQALKKREGELDALKHRLDTMKEAKSTELSTVQEQLYLEQTVRAQAEKALGQYEKEFDQLRAKLKKATDYSGASSIRKAPTCYRFSLTNKKPTGQSSQDSAYWSCG